ncbi:hypothetical protein F4778DRAFT_718694 [Xylariomycetidae sp. FL2044]|nr:hypothetical protein F4778DRAFT_718694 [Xylariomycetidae sp. FL2044]
MNPPILSFPAVVAAPLANYSSGHLSSTRGSGIGTAPIPSHRRRSRSGTFSWRRKTAAADHDRYLADSWNGIVCSAPGKDASDDEARTWMLKVLHRRNHPDPERVLRRFHPSARHLHRANYLAIRQRLKSEPGGLLIAHDMRDALKASRRINRRIIKHSGPRPI